jgi:hypothetical protein
MALPPKYKIPRALAPNKLGYVVRDATGQALAFLYSRDSDAEARQAKVPDERRGAADRRQHRAAA